MHESDCRQWLALAECAGRLAVLKSTPAVNPPLPNFVLIGFMGSGKSSIGRLIAGRLGYRFVDTDALVVRRAGQEIVDIFATHGEAHFRDLETAALESLAGEAHCVIATGGGIVVRERNHALLRRLGFVVLLTATEDVIFERVSRNSKRPLLQTANPRATISEMLAARAPLYEAAAQWMLDTSDLSHREAAEALIAEARRFFSCESAR
ncbi:MAG: aroK [Chthoniobacter sp.]|nr:aroK [Chthoniobacter sp.]